MSEGVNVTVDHETLVVSFVWNGFNYHVARLPKTIRAANQIFYRVKNVLEGHGHMQGFYDGMTLWDSEGRMSFVRGAEYVDENLSVKALEKQKNEGHKAQLVGALNRKRRKEAQEKWSEVDADRKQVPVTNAENAKSPRKSQNQAEQYQFQYLDLADDESGDAFSEVKITSVKLEEPVKSEKPARNPKSEKRAATSNEYQVQKMRVRGKEQPVQVLRREGVQVRPMTPEELNPKPVEVEDVLGLSDTEWASVFGEVTPEESPKPEAEVKPEAEIKPEAQPKRGRGRPRKETWNHIPAPAPEVVAGVMQNRPLF